MRFQDIVAENFRLSEFRDCRNPCLPVPTIIDSTLIRVLQDVRSALGEPVIITSGFRTRATQESLYMERYGNLDLCPAISYHEMGQAADFFVVDTLGSNNEVKIEVVNSMNKILGKNKGGLYAINEDKGKPIMLHFDVRTNERWYGKGFNS